MDLTTNEAMNLIMYNVHVAYLSPWSYNPCCHYQAVSLWVVTWHEGIQTQVLTPSPPHLHVQYNNSGVHTHSCKL